MALSLSAPVQRGSQQQSPVMATTFHRFAALPPEIRMHIWRYFAPIDPRRGPQVLAFEACRPSGYKGEIKVRPCPSLIRQTASIRAVLAVHQESRAEAKRAFPDILGRYRGRVVIRFHREHDVVLVDKLDDEPPCRKKAGASGFRASLPTRSGNSPSAHATSIITGSISSTHSG
ncbi:hypothetical protein PG990_010732 [Apiospora arundinis]